MIVLDRITFWYSSLLFHNLETFFQNFEISEKFYDRLGAIILVEQPDLNYETFY